MGGIGSGRPPALKTRPCVEDCLTADVNKLARDGFVRAGAIEEGHLWLDGPRGPERAEYFLDTAEPHDGYEGPAWAMILDLHVPGGRPGAGSPTRVKLETSTLPSGGVRWWFLCPITGARVSKLYLVPETAVFASRAASGLVYRSQRLTTPDRCREQAQRARRGLGGSGSLVEPFPPRPRGMRRRTYDRILFRALKWESVFFEEQDREIQRGMAHLDRFCERHLGFRPSDCS